VVQTVLNECSDFFNEDFVKRKRMSKSKRIRATDQCITTLHDSGLEKSHIDAILLSFNQIKAYDVQITEEQKLLVRIHLVAGAHFSDFDQSLGMKLSKYINSRTKMKHSVRIQEVSHI